jgi:hypothetical protein
MLQFMKYDPVILVLAKMVDFYLSILQYNLELMLQGTLGAQDMAQAQVMVHIQITKEQQHENQDITKRSKTSSKTKN